MNDATRFEPMTVGMILDRTFRLYSQNFIFLLGIVALANLPTVIWQGLSAALSSVEGLASAWVVGLGCGGLLISAVVVVPWATGAGTIIVSQAYLGETLSFKKSISAAWDRVFTLWLAQLVAGLIVAFGFLLLIVPGILLWLSYVLIAPVIMLEDQDWVEARYRSTHLTSGHRGKIFVVMLLILVLQVVVILGVSVVLELVGLAGAESAAARTVTWLIGFSLQLVVAPLQIVATILFYYDLRIRKEGFDLELLSGAVKTKLA